MRIAVLSDIHSNDMLRVFTEEDLSEFFYYQKGSEWKYDLK